jgi:hypothetical protein
MKLIGGPGMVHEAADITAGRKTGTTAGQNQRRRLGFGSLGNGTSQIGDQSRNQGIVPLRPVQPKPDRIAARFCLYEAHDICLRV